MVFLSFSLSLVSNTNATFKTIRCSKSITKRGLDSIFPRFRKFTCFYFWLPFGFLCYFSFLWLAVVVGFGLATLHRKELYLHLLYCPQIVGIGGRYGSPITRNGIERSYYQPWFCHCILIILQGKTPNSFSGFPPPRIQTGTGKLAGKPDEIPRNINCNILTFRPVPFCALCYIQW